MHRLRVRLKGMLESKSKTEPKPPPKFCEIFVAEKYPPWQEKIVEVLKGCYDAKNATFPSNQEISSLIEKSLGSVNKKAMPFVQTCKEKVLKSGSMTHLQSKLNFSEKDILALANEYIAYALDLEKVWVLDVTAAPDKVRTSLRLPSILTGIFSRFIE